MRFPRTGPAGAESPAALDTDGIASGLTALTRDSGVLADPRPGAWFDYAQAPAPVLLRARVLADCRAGHGVPLAPAAPRLPLRHPAVTSVVAGARNALEEGQNAAHLARDIPQALWDELDTLETP